MSRGSNNAFSAPTGLVAGMVAGDDRALGALYDAYGHVAYGLSFAITGVQSAAESVVAESFAEAWRSASSFDASQTSMLAWLSSIVRRKALAIRGKSERVRSGTTLPGTVGLNRHPCRHPYVKRCAR